MNLKALAPSLWQRVKAGVSPKCKCAGKKIKAPPVGAVPKSNCCGLSPKKPSSLSGPQKLDLKAAVQLRFIGWGKTVGTGEADVSVASPSHLQPGFSQGRFLLRQRIGAARREEDLAEAPGRRPATGPPPAEHVGPHCRSCTDTELAAPRGPRGAGPEIARGSRGGAWTVRACWGSGLLGVEQERWPREGRSQGHALELRGSGPYWAE